MRSTPKSSSIRAGIVGAGLMGRWHAAAIARAHGRIVGVADRDEGSARRLARSYPHARPFVNIENLLNDVSCDVIHVCTPLSTHKRIGEIAIDAGCHVFVEKPLTSEAWEAEQLLDRATQRGVLVCPVHQFVFQDGVLHAREQLHRIGPLVHVEAIFSSAGGAGQREEQLDAIVADILPHPLSLMQAFLPDGLLQDDWTVIKPRAGELRAVTAAAYLSLSLFISMHARPPECAMRIVGAHGTIHLDLFHGYSFSEPGRVSKVQKVWRPFDLALRRIGAAALNLNHRAVRKELAYPGLQRLVKLFYKSVQAHGTSPIAPEVILNLARVRESLLRRQADPSPLLCTAS